MTTSRPRMARHRPWLVAAVASFAVVVPAVTAAATWQNSTITFIEFRDVCRDGIRFGGAIRADHGDTSPVFRDWAIAAQPAPATWADRSTLVMRTRIGIPRAPYGATVPTEHEGDVPVSHEGSFTLRYRDGPLKLAPVALNLRDGNVHSGVNHADVKDCYLFAPIDVEPARRRTRCRSATVRCPYAALAQRHHARGPCPEAGGPSGRSKKPPPAAAPCATSTGTTAPTWSCGSVRRGRPGTCKTKVVRPPPASSPPAASSRPATGSCPPAACPGTAPRPRTRLRPRGARLPGGAGEPPREPGAYPASAPAGRLRAAWLQR